LEALDEKIYLDSKTMKKITQQVKKLEEDIDDNLNTNETSTNKDYIFEQLRKWESQGVACYVEDREGKRLS
jgi:hypothetical protein